MLCKDYEMIVEKPNNKEFVNRMKTDVYKSVPIIPYVLIMLSYFQLNRDKLKVELTTVNF